MFFWGTAQINSQWQSRGQQSGLRTSAKGRSPISRPKRRGGQQWGHGSRSGTNMSRGRSTPAPDQPPAEAKAGRSGLVGPYLPQPGANTQQNGEATRKLASPKKKLRPSKNKKALAVAVFGQMILNPICREPQMPLSFWGTPETSEGGRCVRHSLSESQPNRHGDGGMLMGTGMEEWA